MVRIMMARWLTSVLLAAVVVLPASAAGRAKSSEPKVTAQAAVVMDARTGELLWSHNPDQLRAPASTTKILTTVLALESERLEDTVQVSRNAQAQVPSKLYLRAGQSARLRDLLYALMLKSANDAAVVVAEGVSGSVDRFAQRMTERARAAGARSSQFRNPSGLPDDQHLSTARDLGLILREAVKVPGFTQVASVTTQRIPIATGQKKQWMTLRTKNRLLQGYTVPVIGKTGFTRAAGRCFAGYAEKDGRALIVVVMAARDLWGDTRKLFDWGFKQPADVEPPVPVQVAAKSVKKATWAPGAKKPAPAPVAARKAPPARIEEPELDPEPPVAQANGPASVSSGLLDAPVVPAAAKLPPPKRRDGRTGDGPTRALAPEPAPVQVSAPKPAGEPSRPPAREEPTHVILAMGNGSSIASGRTYYDEFQGKAGVVRRGCTGSGCARSVGEERRR
jgi:D-alanyl-D-alanine carboxypeptidase